MKAFFSLLLAASLGSAFAQCASPYNPDSDGDGVIGSSDLMGLLTTFGNPFCGYDSLNVQTVSDTSAVIDEDTDFVIVEGLNVSYRYLHLPAGETPKVLVVFLQPRTLENGMYQSYEVKFFEDEEQVYFTGLSSTNSIPNGIHEFKKLIRFGGIWYGEGIF